MKNLISKYPIKKILESSPWNYFIDKEDITQIDMYFTLKRWFIQTPIKIKTKRGEYEFQISFESEQKTKERYEEIRKTFYGLVGHNLRAK